ncbi:molybdopterin-binding protein [Alteromonas ponticola]|nr:molybdopterin-binding protein [Alteromonas sp. ASW11-130]
MRNGIASLLTPLYIDVIDYGIVPDQLDAFNTLFDRAQYEVDLLVSSGGVSVGDADLVKEVIKQIGHIDMWKVAIEPGKPSH